MVIVVYIHARIEGLLNGKRNHAMFPGNKSKIKEKNKFIIIIINFSYILLCSPRFYHHKTSYVGITFYCFNFFFLRAFEIFN